MLLVDKVAHSGDALPRDEYRVHRLWVADGPDGQLRLGRKPGALSDKPELERIDERAQGGLADGETLGGRSPVNGALDGEQRVDLQHRLVRDGRLGYLGKVEQLASRFGEAGGLDDRPRFCGLAPDPAAQRLPGTKPETFKKLYSVSRAGKSGMHGSKIRGRRRFRGPFKART